VSRPIQATVYPAALQHNLALVRARAPHSKIMAVIKANGYGHGLLRAAKAMQAADGFAVLEIHEAVTLREAGIHQPILLLEGLFSGDELPVAAQYGLSIVVHCEDQLRMLEAAGMQPGAQQLEVFLKINSGMNRLGFIPGHFWGIYDRLKTCRVVRSMTLMTHFATADETAGVAEQLSRFTALTENIALPKTLANSAALLRYPETHADWVRPGIMLYGATPFHDQSAAELGLQPAMRLASEIIAVQALQPGDSVGYGGLFTAERPMRVGVVACGYADGYPRHAPIGTPLAVAGRRTRTLGRISMDMLYADITDLPEAGIGSPVELWGADIAVDEVAQACGTVGYELLCAVASRVPMTDS
jgi:alanine racemase